MLFIDTNLVNVFLYRNSPHRKIQSTHKGKLEEPEFNGHQAYHNNQEDLNIIIAFFYCQAARNPCAGHISQGKKNGIGPVDLIVQGKHKHRGSGIYKNNGDLGSVGLYQGHAVKVLQEQQNDKTDTSVDESTVNTNKEKDDHGDNKVSALQSFCDGGNC